MAARKIIRGLREAIRGKASSVYIAGETWVKQGHETDAHSLMLLRDKVAELEDENDNLRQRVAELEERLEIDHYFTVDEMTGEKIRVEVPPDDRVFQYDGIECRDATIKLQDEAIDRLRQKLADAQARNDVLRDALKPFTEIEKPTYDD